MLQANKRVAFLPAWQDGCALWRMFMPHLHVPNSVYEFHEGPLRLAESKVVGADVIMVQRLATADNWQALQGLKHFGYKIVYDLDDDMWNIPAYNPGQKILHEYEEGFRACADYADVITVSTEMLAMNARMHFKGLAAKIVVVPNMIDTNLFYETQWKRDKVVVGWGGSGTHSLDLQNVVAALEELLDELPEMWVEFIGMAPTEKMMNHERVSFTRWVPTSEYPARFSDMGWAISLAPLEHRRFNQSKSNIKFLEAAAVGAVCLGSSTLEYKRFCAFDEANLNDLLCDSKEEWKAKIKELVLDEALRKKKVKAMQAVSRENFDLSTGYQDWVDVLQEAALC